MPLVRYQPSKTLAEVYRSVYKVRNRLLACKNMDFIQTRSSSRERRVSSPSFQSSRTNSCMLGWISHYHILT